MKKRQPAPETRELIEYFDWAHLTGTLQSVSRPCGNLADHMVEELPDGPELRAGLRKLLEAKDCFVRAKVRELRG
jgi:hypothetical protein